MDTQDHIETTSGTELDDFDAPLIAPVSPRSGKSSKSAQPGFWSGLLKGQLNISRHNLVVWWPGLAAFLWFASLVLFGAMSLFIYIPQGKADEGLRVFGLICALHLGALVVLFLATVVENPDPAERAQGPFALSLQAGFIEALSVAGLLIIIISKEKFDRVTLPIFNKYLDLTLPSMAGKDELYLSVYGGLLIIILVLSFYGFSLLKRRDRLSSPMLKGQFQNEGEPPIDSDSPRQRITYLMRLKADLQLMAQRAEAEALRDEVKLKDIAIHLAETEDELKAVEAEILALCHDHEAFCTTQACLKSQIEALSTKAADPARTRSRKWLEKIKRLLVSGLGVVDSGDGLFLDALERLRLTEAALQEAITQRSNDQKTLESEMNTHRAEAQKLAQQVAQLEAELNALELFATHIDATNDVWRQSYEWTALIGKDEFTVSHAIPANTYNTAKLYAKGADTIDKIRTGIVWLFGFTALLAVIGDFLIEMPELPDAVAMGLSPVAMGLLIACIGTYWAFKLIYSVGLMGSWRSITSSYRDYGNDDSPPLWGTTLRIMASNAVGILAFAALFVPLIKWINHLAAGNKTHLVRPVWFGEHLPDIDLRDITNALGGVYQDVFTILTVAGLLMFLAPMFIHIWEAQFRRTKDHSSALAIFKAVVMGIIGLGGLALISIVAERAGDLLSFGLVQKPTTPVVSHTHLQCPLDQLPNNEGVRVNAWRLGAVNEVALSLTPSLMTAPSSCQIDINPLGDTNYIVLIGTASEQGSFAVERERAAQRINNAASFLTPALRDAITSGKVSIYSVNLSKYCIRTPSGKCRRTERLEATDPTIKQRPLIIVSGHIAPNEEVIPEVWIGQKVDTALTGLGIELNNYPDRVDKIPVKRLLDCHKDSCELTIAPQAPKPKVVEQMVITSRAKSLTPPALPMPDSPLQASENTEGPQTAVTAPEPSGN